MSPSWGHPQEPPSPALTLAMLKLTVKLCPSPSTCQTQILQASSQVLGLRRSRVKVQCRKGCSPLQMW